jgi:hypothetical protein
MDNQVIEGSWIGSYGYNDGRLPVQFDANFTLVDDPETLTFTGTIRDNGPLGEAHVDGQQLGRAVFFTKYYTFPLADSLTGRVEYTGELAEDGNSIAGSWTLRSGGTGPWQVFRYKPDARRSDCALPSLTYDHPALTRSADLPPMTAKSYGGQLTLTKPRSPTVVGQSKSFAVVVATIAALAALFLYALFALTHYSRSIYAAVILVFCWPLFTIGRLVYIWYRMFRYGDVYLLDRDKNRIVRNTKYVGKVSEIGFVENKALGPAGASATVSLILSDGRRVFVETGKAADVSEIAKTIAQFAGVEILTVA